MGQHKREGIKGDGYKAAQRVECQPRRIKPAQLNIDKWMYRHGWRKAEDGKWHHS